MASAKGILYLVASMIFVGLITFYIGVKFPGEPINPDFQTYSKKNISVEQNK